MSSVTCHVTFFSFFLSGEASCEGSFIPPRLAHCMSTVFEEQPLVSPGSAIYMTYSCHISPKAKKENNSNKEVCSDNNNS